MRKTGKLGAAFMASVLAIFGAAVPVSAQAQAQHSQLAQLTTPEYSTAPTSFPQAAIRPAALPLANAQAIRSLNIMLMVTSLRCRTGANDFRSEYDMFARAHRQNLEDAHKQLSGELAATHGEEGSHRALDRIGVSIANRYGDGHPTMGCRDLKEAALELAMNQDREALAAMAGRLLGGEAPLIGAAIAQPRIAPQWTGGASTAVTAITAVNKVTTSAHHNRAKAVP